MSSFEFTPVDKTVRSPLEMMRRKRNRISAALAEDKANTSKKRDMEVEAEATIFRDLKATRDMSILSGNTSAPISMKLVILATAQHFELPSASIRGTSRLRVHVRPRQVAIYLCKKFTSASLPTIGMAFKRDHTTVMHSIWKVDELIAAGDQEIVKALDAIEEAIEP